MNNTGKMLAALMVATVGLGFTPMASASHETCPSSMLDLGFPGADTNSVPSNDKVAYRFDLTGATAVDAIVRVQERDSNSQVKVTIWTLDETPNPDTCHSTDYDEESVPDFPSAGEEFPLLAGEKYVIIIEDADATGSESYLIEALPAV